MVLALVGLFDIQLYYVKFIEGNRPCTHSPFLLVVGENNLHNRNITTTIQKLAFHGALRSSIDVDARKSYSPSGIDVGIDFGVLPGETCTVDRGGVTVHSSCVKDDEEAKEIGLLQGSERID
jgi:hypothetical protein